MLLSGLKCMDCEADIYYNATKDLYVCRACDNSAEKGELYTL